MKFVIIEISIMIIEYRIANKFFDEMVFLNNHIIYIFYIIQQFIFSRQEIDEIFCIEIEIDQVIHFSKHHHSKISFDIMNHSIIKSRYDINNKHLFMSLSHLNFSSWQFMI